MVFYIVIYKFKYFKSQIMNLIKLNVIEVYLVIFKIFKTKILRALILTYFERKKNKSNIEKEAKEKNNAYAEYQACVVYSRVPYVYKSSQWLLWGLTFSNTKGDTKRIFFQCSIF